jgi:hypothetical protein
MLRLCLSFALMLTMGQALAQSPVVGEWKRISATIDHQGQKVDMHAALLQQRPCVAKIRLPHHGRWQLPPGRQPERLRRQVPQHPGKALQQDALEGPGPPHHLSATQ